MKFHANAYSGKLLKVLKWKFIWRFQVGFKVEILCYLLKYSLQDFKFSNFLNENIKENFFRF